MRRCLLEPIPEFDLAAKLLDGAAEALLQGNLELAAQLTAQSDFDEIREQAIRIVGKLSDEVHRQTKRPKTLPKEFRDPTRMPAQLRQYSIFARDGWRCRFCGVKVVSKKARKLLVDCFPVETHWIGPEFERHAALYAMAVSLDHVVPHSQGGKNDDSNFVTACYCCQFGRGEWALAEAELIDPRERDPVVDEWDGLSRLDGVVITAKTHKSIV